MSCIFSASSNTLINLPNGNRNISIPLPKDILLLLNTGDYKITSAQLGYFQLQITLTRIVSLDINKLDTSFEDGIGAIDLGLIHTAVITNGQASEAYVGRLLRSLKILIG